MNQTNAEINVREQRKANAIRRQYLAPQDSNIRTLQKLDSKVKLPGKILSAVLGTAGTLVLGAGMAQVMVWDNMALCLRLGIPGLLAALLAYPVYSAVTARRKKKYAPEIMRLSDERFFA